MNDSILHDVCYVDTNIFVYLHDGSAPAKQRISAQLCAAFSQTGKGRISVQVLAEWRNTMMRKFSSQVDKEARRRFIRLLEAWQPLVVTPAVILRAEELCDKYKFSPYDSLHVQCALDMGCRWFLSEDMQDGLTVNGTLTFCNPYKEY
ncbi:PIN domain-containing protein [Candidatus Electronema sp. TJ]|uniref:PIN domain-containing protein n=1 Tax=Candidatus Electronema sp. TJ TaxID=3401573 RepID=UPI003AA7EF5D